MILLTDVTGLSDNSSLIKQLHQLMVILEDRGFVFVKDIKVCSLLATILRDNGNDPVLAAKKVSKCM